MMPVSLNNNNKVISFLLSTLPADGASRVILNLIGGFVERGLKVELVVLKAEGDAMAWIPPGVRIVELNAQICGIHKLFYLFALIRYLRREKPAALFVCRDDLNLGSIAKYLAVVNTQVIFICHCNLFQYLQHCSDSVKHSFTAYLLRKFLGFYNWADTIVTVSQGVADGLTKLAGRPLKQMRVIYNPVVTPEMLAKAQEPIYHPWFAPEEPPVIISVGRLQALKDFPTLIQAFALVRQQMPIRLAILGEGDERSRLQQLIDELGLTSEIALLGFVSNPHAYVSKAAACVMSSIVEGLPTVLIEALAVGTPVISTNCPSGPAEILDFGKYGTLVPMGDYKALAKAITSTLNTTVDVQALQQRAQNFSLETAVNNYLELLNFKPQVKVQVEAQQVNTFEVALLK
jgi:glycosyltransferase involved in cell wall biosynthesis